MAESLEHGFKDLPLRAGCVARRADGRQETAIDLMLTQGVDTALDYAAIGDIDRARALSNPDLAPHVEIVDMAGHGCSVVTAGPARIDTEFIYALVNSRGAVEDKRQMVADYTDPGFHLDPYVVAKPIVRQWPDSAVIGGEVTLAGTSDGKPFKRRLRFADIWRRRAGRWQVAFTEVTPVK